MKKIVAFLMVMVMMLTCLTACGSKGKEKVDNTVEDTENLWIYVETKGYGSDMVYALAEAFEEKHPGVEVHVTETVLESVISSQLDLGPSGNDYDLVFWLTSGRDTRNQYQNKFEGYSDGMQDLTEIYKTTIPGEDVTLEEKMLDTYAECSNVGTAENPQYFGIPFVTGTMGWNYNIDVLKELYGADYEAKLPNTTDEFVALCSDIKANDKTAIVFPGQIDHVACVAFFSFWAQYEGLENYQRFWKGEAYDDVSGTYISPSKNIYNQKGRAEALRVIESLISYESGFVAEDVMDYNSTNFRSLQTKFLEKDMGYVFYPCGDWLENESGTDGNSEFARMKNPVISSIIDRLKTVDNDAELSAIVDYVDGKTETVNPKHSAEDIEQVRQARNMMTGSHGFDHTVVMPAYSNAKTLAKEFLLFMASDEGIEVFKKNCKGGFLPFEYEYDLSESSYLSTFEKSIAKDMNDMIVVGKLPLSDLYSNLTKIDGLTVGTIDALLGAKPSSKYYYSAEKLIEEMKVSDSEWDTILFNSGSN